MRALFYIMTPILILTVILASRFVTWDKLKGVDKNAATYLTNSTQLLRQEKIYEAITELTQAIEIEPKYAEAYINRGLAYYHLAHYKEAIADFTQTISLKQYTTDAYARRGDVYLALNEVPHAITDYTASLNRSKNAGVLSKRGRCFLETGNYDGAISDFSDVVQHLPTAIAYYNRGRSYYEKHIYSDKKTETLKLALDDFNKSIEMQPMYAIAYLSRGDVYGYLEQSIAQESDYSQATTLLTAAILNWDNESHGLIPILLWRAVAYKKGNQMNKAENDVERIYHIFAEFYLKKIRKSDIL